MSSLSSSSNLSPQNDAVVAPSIAKPKLALPPGAVDVHAHVFGPYERFPLITERMYTPPIATYEAYVAMLDHVGFSHGVLVHAAASGFDCSATADALMRSKTCASAVTTQQRLRGVAVVAPDIADSELTHMHMQGFRGLRFTENGSQYPGARPPGILGFDDLEAFAPRLSALGWHANIWAKCELIAGAATRLASYGVPLVIDHMGYFDATRGVADASFQTLLALAKDGIAWVKMTPLRNSENFPGYAEVRPFHDALLHSAPDRLLWGSDWPFLGLTKRQPEVGLQIDLFDSWTEDATLRQKIYVDNPKALYGF